MAADSDTFIQVFPEFQRLAVNKGAIDFWLLQAANQLALGVLGKNADLACYLFAAHNLVLNAQDFRDVQGVDGLPGDTLGPVASKSAGGLSVSYDTGSLADDSAGVYNSTSYGQRLWKMIASASLGGVYAGQFVRPTVFSPIRGL